jgi:hypothetical protein
MLTFLLFRMAYVWNELRQAKRTTRSGLEGIRVPVARGSLDRR